MLVSENVANGVRVSFKRIGIYEIEAFEILNAFYRLRNYSAKGHGGVSSLK